VGPIHVCVGAEGVLVEAKHGQFRLHDAVTGFLAERMAHGHAIAGADSKVSARFASQDDAGSRGVGAAPSCVGRQSVLAYSTKSTKTLISSESPVSVAGRRVTGSPG